MTPLIELRNVGKVYVSARDGERVEVAARRGIQAAANPMGRVGTHL